MLEQLNELLQAIERYWKLTNYEIQKPVYSKYNDSKYIKTQWSYDAVLLPLTKLPIRGLEGVNITQSNGEENTILLLIETALKPFEDWELQYKKSEELEAKNLISNSLNNIFAEFDKIPSLNERIFDAEAYKHYDATQLSTVVAKLSSSGMRIRKIFALEKILTDELNNINYKFPDEISLESRYNIAERVLDFIKKLATRVIYKYQVLIFLNAPLVDDSKSIPLGKVKINDPIFEADINISYADDQFLSKLSLLNVSLLNANFINTVCSFNIKIPVDASIDKYLLSYEFAGRVAEKLVDSLRLVCNCDLGVLGLEVVPDESFTPAIRKIFETRYQQELAPLIPKRFHYQLDSLVPITEAEINEVRQLLSSDWYPNTIKGMDIAIKRFRSSIEKYMPYDTEKLLDLAIAFEAIYLNDGENKELTYRLSLRAARLLGNSFDERYEIFKLIKDLYKYRSKVAHGEHLDSLKKPDAERVDKVLKDAPNLLKKSIIKMLSVNELKGLKNDAKIAEWWSKLELE